MADRLHVMMDLETWGTRPGSAIRSIGLIGFNGDDAGASYYANITDESCQMAGLTRDEATVEWWSRQSDDAQGAFESPEPLPLTGVVSAVDQWARPLNYDEVCVWAHGAPFDPPLWEAACHAVGMKAPWKFWNLRDTRTLFDLAGIKSLTPYRTGDETHHNALDDCRVQIRAVQDAYRKLGKELT